jgi:glutathione S-transferase
MHERIVWGVGTPRTFRVHWALLELALPYETRGLQTRTAATVGSEYKKLNVAGKIPTLVDGDITVSESSGIINYLAAKYDSDERRLMPSDIPSIAEYHEWISFISMELDATSLYVLRRHEGLPDVYGRADVACIAARDYFSRMILAASEKIKDGRVFLLGTSFTGADIMMVSTLDWADRCGCDYPSAFKTYREQIIARTSYSLALQANKAT